MFCLLHEYTKDCPHRMVLPRYMSICMCTYAKVTSINGTCKYDLSDATSPVNAEAELYGWTRTLTSGFPSRKGFSAHLSTRAETAVHISTALIEAVRLRGRRYMRMFFCSLCDLYLSSLREFVVTKKWSHQYRRSIFVACHI